MFFTKKLLSNEYLRIRLGKLLGNSKNGTELTAVLVDGDVSIITHFYIIESL